MKREHLEQLIYSLKTPLRAEIPQVVKAQLADFAKLVAQWNRRMNLTAAKDSQDLCEVLFADALVLAGVVSDSARVVDVGSGAGAPGIPLFLLRQDLEGLLVEPLHKRCTFLRFCLAELGLLDRVSVAQQSIPTDGPPPPQHPVPQFKPTVAMSRATFAPADWLPLGQGLLPTGAPVVVLASQPLQAPSSPNQVIEYTWPLSGRQRWLGVW